MTHFHQHCFNSHALFCQTKFERYTRHTELVPLLQSLPFETTMLGHSVEQRSIHCLRIGHGPIKILAWSQMHGDESTATGALLDCINFMQATDSTFMKERAAILDRISLHFIPMLNPDGVERWQRVNALGIDLNRDALRQVSPESRILQAAFDNIQPHYGFNLHDQESYYTAGMSNIPASISLLAPPTGETAEPASREKAIKTIVALNRMLQNYIPNGVGKWNDDYEPRAFGEHFQSLGTSTILIEAGGYPNDPLRHIPRKLNFTALLHAFHGIAQNDFEHENSADYHLIPLNQKGRLFDLILRNARVEKQGLQFKCDLGFRKTVRPVGIQLETNWTMEDMGDLSCFSGYVEEDLSAAESIQLNDLLTNPTQWIQVNKNQEL